MTTQTANGKYDYTQVYGLKQVTLDFLINHAHRVLSEKSGWNYFPLKKGSFGYDNMAMSIGYMFDHYYPNQSLDECADNVHKGWTENYIFWRDTLPFQSNPELYIAPFNPLGDERRNICASTPYSQLPQEEKDKDLIIAEAVLIYI